MASEEKVLSALEALTHNMNAQFGAVNKRLDRIETDIELIKEDAAVTRVAVNQLIEWADRVGEAERIPFVAFS